MAREISLLISELSSPDAEVRSSAAEALSRLGSDARGAAVSLARCVGDDDEEFREWVVAALEELGPPSASDLAALVKLLTQETPDVAYWAATLIGRLDERAVAAVSALCAALEEGRPVIVRERAVWALGRIGRLAGETAITALNKAADVSQPRISRLARRALDRILH
jgi:HEAT repeat protein